MTLTAVKHDPTLDLLLERTVDVPKALIWKAWTTPELITQWFAPTPWATVACEIDLRPGGVFATTMRSPEGEEFPAQGCYLEIVENEKLVWSTALEADFRPVVTAQACSELLFTAVILLEAQGQGTKYTVIAKHGDEASRQKHQEMGFQTGWNAALDQLVALMKTV
jgi:uncharacterized protein YndB with AHSA1/START domain